MDDIYPPKMTIIEHLEELRRRIIISLAFFLIVTVVSFIFVDRLAHILRIPSIGIIKDLVFLTPTEAFIAYLKIAMLAGFIIAIPFIIVQLGLFLMPAIPPDKRKSIFIWLGASFLLSITGIMFSYFLALPFALKFLINFAEGVAVPMISVGKYFSFAGAFLLMGAAIFQIPVVIGFLSTIGILKTSFLRRNRKYAVVIILIISALITPTQDIFNMLIFAVPMWALYEIGILASRIIEKKRSTQ